LEITLGQTSGSYFPSRLQLRELVPGVNHRSSGDGLKAEWKNIPMMRKITLRAVSGIVVAFAFLLAGCAPNGYRDFYQASSGISPKEIEARRIGPPPELPELIRGSDPTLDIQAAYQQGFGVIGSSSFNGVAASDKQLIEHAKSIGADRVLSYGVYQQTIQTAVPLTMPTTQTSVTNGSATIYGPRGTSTAYGSAQTTTFGSQTTFMPVSINRFDFLAIYLVKVRAAFGANFRDITTQEAQQIGTVNAVSIVVVQRGSPAASAGFLPEDIITKFDGQPVLGSTNLVETLKQKQNKKVMFSVLRRGKPISLALTLGSY